jgi:predicted Zn-dependent protease
MERVTATYFDGDSSTHRSATLQRIDDRLVIRLEGGMGDIEWPLQEVRLTEEVHPGQPARLRRLRQDNGRLVISDPGGIDQVLQLTRRLRRGDYRRRAATKRAAFWVAMLILAVVGIWRGLPLAAEPIAAVVPVDWEEALGRSVQKQVLSYFGGSGTCRGAAGHRALRKLVDRLGASIRHRYVFRITVVDSSLVNAAAAPGGYIIIFRGLIDKSDNPEALAGVLAHEIGHVIERHGTENIIKVLGLSAILSTMTGNTSGVVGESTAVVTNLIAKGYSRDAEREADEIAIRILNSANIKGAGLVSFFQWVAKRQGGTSRLGNYLSTHPEPSERAENIRIKTKGTTPAMSETEWQAVKKMCQKQ